MIYIITKAFLAVVFKLFYRFSVTGRENLGEGPVVLAANHSSYLDPPVVGVASSRPVYFMAKEELFGVPGLGWYINHLHAFPVKRGTLDRAVLRAALAHLKQDRAILVFPEGTRSPEGLTEALPGAAFIAEKAGAKIVPTAIQGTQKVFPQGARWPRFPKITVQFGEPIELDGIGDRKAIMNQATRRMMEAISAMLEEGRK